MMGTRTGDIDPAVVFHLQRVAGMSVDEVDTLFNKKSGMKGMTGESDMRSVWDMIHNDEDPEAQQRARVAMDVYINRLLKYVGPTPPSWAAWTSLPSPLHRRERRSSASRAGRGPRPLRRQDRRGGEQGSLRRAARHFRPRLDGDNLRLPDQ